jgi:hypothetical protein
LFLPLLVPVLSFVIYTVLTSHLFQHSFPPPPWQPLLYIPYRSSHPPPGLFVKCHKCFGI